MSTESDSNPRRQKAQMFFKYGNDAAMKNNFDYAIQMYQEACKLAPEDLKYRQALRGIERRKFGNEPAKVGRLAGARIQPIRLRLKTAKAKGQWAHALEVCEEVFAHDPWNVDTARDMADAAERLDLKEVACFALESVYLQAGDDVHFLRHQARVYELNQDYQRAIHCWERVRKLAPTDEDAKRQINALSANATIARSGLGDAIQRAVAGNAPTEPTPVDLEELKRQALPPEERLQREIELQPDRVGLYLELVDLHKRHNRLDEAERVLARGLKTNPTDEVLRKAHAEIQVARLRRAIDAYGRRVQDNPDDHEAKAKLDQLKEKLDHYELKELRRRIEVHPEDLDLHYQLGLVLVRQGQHGPAIAEFQQARSSPKLKVQALFQLGLAFEADGNPKLAERSLQDALKAADDSDQTLLNTINYHLGLIYESLGQVAKAEEHYNEVAANDYAFRDVAQRLRNLHKQPID
jgi:tetratricopeptide (TPR) repeat protein